jgi:hypothetical protein
VGQTLSEDKKPRLKRSEFHGSEERSTMGRMGDIRGRPNQEDLEKIRQDSQKLVRGIHTRSDI